MNKETIYFCGIQHLPSQKWQFLVINYGLVFNEKYDSLEEINLYFNQQSERFKKQGNPCKLVSYKDIYTLISRNEGNE